jgi:mannose/cellobiose epimerase-like protein (N-acyl-D-glucosamine 2-epimerase family)
MMELVSRRTLLSNAGAIALLADGSAIAQQEKVSKPAGSHIDAEWFQRVLADETERSLKTLVTPTGFLGSTGQRGGRAGASPAPAAPGSYRPTGLGTGTPTAQGRNLFVLAAGYDVTRKQEFLDAVIKAADFMLTSFRDKQYGGLFAQVDPDGQVVDDRKESYGTAHAIMGLSHAARVSDRKTYGDAALQIWSDMKKGLRDQHGFYKRETSRDFKIQGPGKNTQNPMMHLFEGLLALHDATKSQEVFHDAQAHADNVLAHLLQKQGYIPELYDADWKPIPAGPPGQTEPDGSPLDVYNSYAPAAQTGHVEVGHQIEWSFFLSRAVEKGFPSKYLPTAEARLRYALRVGYDAKTGGIGGYADYSGKLTAPTATTGWQICEFLKALMNWAVLRDRQDLWEPFDRSSAAVKSTSPLPGGYHGCGMYVEAIRLAGMKA